MRIMVLILRILLDGDIGFLLNGQSILIILCRCTCVLENYGCSFLV